METTSISQSNTSRRLHTPKGILATAAACALAGLLSMSLPSRPDLPKQYFSVDMTAAKGTGTVTATVVTKTTVGNPNPKTTTVTINVTAGTPGALKLQALEAALDAATSSDGSNNHYVDATYIPTPGGALAIASSGAATTVASVSIKDQGTLQKSRSEAVRTVESPEGPLVGELIIFGEPTGLNPEGLPSSISVSTDRDEIVYAVNSGDSLESVTAELLRQLLTSGFAVNSPAEGVFVFSLNEAHDSLALGFGCDDLGIQYAIKIR